MKIYGKLICLAVIAVLFFSYLYSPFTETAAGFRLQALNLFCIPMAFLSNAYEYMAAILNVGSLIEKNKQLEAKLSETKTKLCSLYYLEEENSKLKDFLDFKKGSEFKSVSAELIGRSKKNFLSVGILDKGKKDGIETNFYVVNSMGIVGKVIEVTDNISKINFADDANFKITAKIKGMEDAGLLQGSFQNNICGLKYIPRESNIKNGDIVVTESAGADLPQGIPVGRIKKIALSENGFFYEAAVRMFVDLRKVKYVLVIKK